MYEVRDDPGKQIFTLNPTMAIPPMPNMTSLSDTFSANRNLAFGKTMKFVHSSEQLKYLNPLAPNAIYGSILRCGISSFTTAKSKKSYKQAPNALYLYCFVVLRLYTVR